jgi:small-conductance mechanosensitive channel
VKIFKCVILNRLKGIAARTKTELDDLLIKIVDRIGWPFYLVLALYIGLQFIQVPGIVETALYYAAVVVVAYYAVRGIQDLIDYYVHKLLLKRRGEESGDEREVDTSLIDLLNKGLKCILWIVAGVLVLEVFGYHVTTLIAGIGILGIAIAFALQHVLVDVFASFTIYLDKPFKIGDFIIVGDDLGVVKKIGIKSTRIQTLQGEELVMSNKELTETRVHNYKRMEKRRIVFQFGVTYETTTQKLERIPVIVKEVIERIEMVDIDRVHFLKFGDFSLVFEVVYYVATRDYNKYMDTQQAINLGIKKRFEEEEIEMAYPTQTVFVNKVEP